MIESRPSIFGLTGYFERVVALIPRWRTAL
jgi:hypothetical protein